MENTPLTMKTYVQDTVRGKYLIYQQKIICGK